MSVELHSEFLSLKGGCTGSSESIIAKCHMVGWLRQTCCSKSHHSTLTHKTNVFESSIFRPIPLESVTCSASVNSGADPGFLERGFICKNVWGFTLLFLNIL